MEDTQAYVEQLGARARAAARSLTKMTGQTKVRVLNTIADRLDEASDALVAANAKDLHAAEAAGTAKPLIKRLMLDATKVAAMAAGVREIASQVDPVGQVIDGYHRPNGLRIVKTRVPIGVILFFYESRPNVTSDAAALCIKSGNAVILRGGKEAFHSNQAIAAIIRQALESAGADPHAVQVVESTDRALVPMLLKLDRYIDLVIPRGGESLIRAVVADATMPVLKHFTGNCHVYVDANVTGIEKQVRDVCVNAKTSYPGGAVCNAAEHILFHRDAPEGLLAGVCGDLAAEGVEIRADDAARKLYPKAKPATDADWDTEYLDLVVGVKVVDSLDDAIDHINRHSSHHTDAILSTSIAAINAFTRDVDSASVMVNASTRLADGGEYGLGAEIGISTDKLHARGPMGATDLTTYKWIVTGDMHLR